MPSFKQSQTFFNMNFVRNGPITLEWYAFYCGAAPKFNACHKTDAETIFRQYQISLCANRLIFHWVTNPNYARNYFTIKIIINIIEINGSFIFWMWNFYSKIKLTKSAKIEWFVCRNRNWCELKVILSAPKNGVLLQTNSFKCETFGEPASFDCISNGMSKRRHHDQKSCTQTLPLIQFNQCGIFTRAISHQIGKMWLVR